MGGMEWIVDDQDGSVDTPPGGSPGGLTSAAGIPMPVTGLAVPPTAIGGMPHPNAAVSLLPPGMGAMSAGLGMSRAFSTGDLRRAEQSASYMRDLGVGAAGTSSAGGLLAPGAGPGLFPALAGVGIDTIAEVSGGAAGGKDSARAAAAADPGGDEAGTSGGRVGSAGPTAAPAPASTMAGLNAHERDLVSQLGSVLGAAGGAYGVYAPGGVGVGAGMPAGGEPLGFPEMLSLDDDLRVAYHPSARATAAIGASAAAMRRSQSTGDLARLRAMHDAGAAGINAAGADARLIGSYTRAERDERIRIYREKRYTRNFNRRIKYVCRKTLADSRPRVRGRFARHDVPLEEQQAAAGVGKDGKAGGGKAKAAASKAAKTGAGADPKAGASGSRSGSKGVAKSRSGSRKSSGAAAADKGTAGKPKSSRSGARKPAAATMPAPAATATPVAV